MFDSVHTVQHARTWNVFVRRETSGTNCISIERGRPAGPGPIHAHAACTNTKYTHTETVKGGRRADIPIMPIKWKLSKPHSAGKVCSGPRGEEKAFSTRGGGGGGPTEFCLPRLPLLWLRARLDQTPLFSRLRLVVCR